MAEAAERVRTRFRPNFSGNFDATAAGSRWVSNADKMIKSTVNVSPTISHSKMTTVPRSLYAPTRIAPVLLPESAEIAPRVTATNINNLVEFFV